MRHNKKGRKLGTSKAHTKAMKRSLVTALFENDRIKTVEARAKEIRPDVDKIITWAKKGDLHSRRLAIAALGGNKELVREVFEKVEKGMFKDRKGGYTRIMKLGYRIGDNAPIVIIELVTEGVSKKKKSSDSAAPAKSTAKAAKGGSKSGAAAKKAKEAAAEAESDEIVVEGEEVEESKGAAEASEEAADAGADADASEADEAESDKADEDKKEE